ncbi:MAG: gliding motility-associated C-terminal domain-containing protein [Bacteroidota bacterium]
MLKYGLYIVFLFSGFVTCGQVCDGNFGANIFGSGDFGSGSDQILPNDPQIAPGYRYTTTLPPEDGYYLIVNQMNASEIFPDWLAIGDNSSDENGYMMVVNADFAPGLFYEQTITGLCENVLYEFSANVINLIQSWSTDRIDPNVSFLLDDKVVYTTGNIPKNEQWNTYGFTFTTGPGQTELKLSLRNNAPGGIGNDLALDNITFRPCGSEALILPATVANICEDGEPINITATIIGSVFENKFIQWQQSFDEGRTWIDLAGETDLDFTFDNLNSGFYYYRYLLADSQEKLSNEKCRTFSNTKVIRVIPKFVNVTDSICQGLSVSIGNSIYSTSGIYVDSLQNIIGCDSIVTMDLTIVEDELKGFFRVVDPSCDDFSNGSIQVEKLTSKGPYSVEIDYQPKEPPWRITQLDEGSYNYTITDRYGCVLDTLIQITDPPPFEVNLGPDQTLILGERFEASNIVSETASNYEWNSESIDCEPPCTSISELFLEDITVSLAAISKQGCEAYDEVQIIIEQVTDVFIPNIITPNQDGKNDFFTVYPKEINAIEMVNELSIYSRSGKKLFEKYSFEPGIPELGWNGSQDGRKVASGVYYYAANVKFINGKSTQYVGYVSLLR